MSLMKLNCVAVCCCFALVACSGDESPASTQSEGEDMTAVQVDMSGDMREQVVDADMSSSDMNSMVVVDMEEDDMQDSVEDMSSLPDDMMSGDMGEMDLGGGDEDMASSDMGMVTDALYVGNSDVFASGPLTVVQGETTASDLPLSVWHPSEAGEYAVVVFQHGFLMNTSYYDLMLRHIASHGFIVAAPQMYAPGDNPLSAPGTEEEAANAKMVWETLDVTLPTVLTAGVVPRVDKLGAIGHSRGGKVIWMNLIDDPNLLSAAVGLDPVDTTGVGLATEPRAIPANGFAFSLPSLFIGTGLGSQPINAFAPACAPEMDSYPAFFAGAMSPAYELVALEYGHMDMLDDDPVGCGFACSACVDGEGPRDLMRKASAGWSVALFRGALQGSQNAVSSLIDPTLAPVSASGRVK